MLSRPRCDPFDVTAIRSAIERGETSERAAYLEYAASAGRPYARSTFSAMVRRKVEPAPKVEPERPTCADVLDRWRERVTVKPRILSLGPGGGLRVQKGALIVFDGETRLTYTKAAKPPSAIVLSSAGVCLDRSYPLLCSRSCRDCRSQPGAWFLEPIDRRTLGERRVDEGAGASRASQPCADDRHSEA